MKQSINTKIIEDVAREMDLSCVRHDVAGNFISVKAGRQKFFFSYEKTPFNSEIAAEICKDKEFAYKILHNSVLMPKTIGFLNPDYSGKYSDLIAEKNIDAITEKIESEFSYPVIIKMNRGQRCQNVFKCADSAEIKIALQKIYDKTKVGYDYIALAQEYIPTVAEYRAVFYKGNLEILYRKAGKRIFYEKKSDAAGEIIAGEKFLNKVSDFARPIFSEIDLSYVGLDIVENSSGELFLIELNTAIGFGSFVKKNGSQKVKDFFVKIFQDLI